LVSTLGSAGVPAGPADGPAAVLEVQGLTKTYTVGKYGAVKVVRALTNVDLTIAKGEVVGLVGESGSGKTTFARTAALLEHPTAGQIWVEGKPVPRHISGAAAKAHRNQVQMIFQDPYTSIDPLHKVRYHVGRPMTAFGTVAKAAVPQAIEDVLTQVGLVPPKDFLARYPYQLSGGQRQRVGIARALAAQPSLILADEPTSMLDVSIRLNVMNLLLDLQKSRQLSMVFVTHDLAGASYMSDRIAIMYAGHLVELGPTDDVMGNPRHPYTQLLRKAAPDPAANLDQEVHFEARGDPPDLTNLPPGCPFAPRCPQARSECHEALPEWRQIGPNHKVRCVLY
jgi:peptide/nickel transport system ATP-binding protein